MWHCLLLELDPMLGVDFHGEITATPVPAPAPFIPHVAGMFLHGWTPLGPSMTVRSKTAANYLRIVQKGSDISFGIIHVPTPVWPPCVLAVIITTVGSGSKSYFGPTSVVAEGTPVASALIPPAYNINLNCGTIPTPTGNVLAPCTVVTGMTWGDILGGLVAMVIDCALQAAMNYLCGFICKWSVLAKVLGKCAPTLKTVLENAIPAIVQQITGSPIGYTFSVPGHIGGNPDDSTNPWNPGNWGNWVGNKVQKAIDGPGPSTSPSQPASVNPGTSPHPGGTDPGVENH
jgi:hypothetical protein